MRFASAAVSAMPCVSYQCTSYSELLLLLELKRPKLVSWAAAAAAAAAAGQRRAFEPLTRWNRLPAAAAAAASASYSQCMRTTVRPSIP